MHISEQKSQLRDSIKERMERMSAKTRNAEERSLCRRLREFLGTNPRTITAFVPLKDEVDIRPVLQELLEEGWRIFLPTFQGGALAFRQALRLDNLKPGHLNIPEPPSSSPLLDGHELDIALVPGRAFTKKGQRLGRGNGGYDLWIAQQRKWNPRTRYVGIALECQIVDELPLEPHDQKLDMVLTARS